MFKESFERGSGEDLGNKTDLEKKMDQLTLMRRKKVALEAQMKIPTTPSEAEKIEKEYHNTSEMVELIEKDVNDLKAAENARLTAKFERVDEKEASNDSDFDAFDKALNATGEGYDADRLDARKRAA